MPEDSCSQSYEQKTKIRHTARPCGRRRQRRSGRIRQSAGFAAGRGSPADDPESGGGSGRAGPGGAALVRAAELYEEYRWRQWQYTNRARLPYRRYVEVDLQGDYFYDLYGNYLTQGWLVFNTAQTRPQEAGSTLFKTNVFERWFNQLVIAGDRKGQYHYALTVSNNLRTTLTPLAFSKPRLNGFQLDLAMDKYQMTFLHSLISGPRAIQETERAFTDATSLAGGRFVAQVGDFVEVGLHAVSAHQTNSLTDELVETLHKGSLTNEQNQTVAQIEIQLRDDSPEDGRGGRPFSRTPRT